MTAYQVARICCDQGDPGVGADCPRKYEVAAASIEEARRLAAARGWGRVPASPGDEGDRCPEHNPA